MILLAYIAGSVVTALAVLLGYFLGTRESIGKIKIAKIREAMSPDKPNLSGPVKPLSIAQKKEKEVVVPIKNRMKRLFGTNLDRPEQNVVEDIDGDVR